MSARLLCGLVAGTILTGVCAAAWIPGLAWAFRFTCHQLPERSFFIGGYQLGVCVRCLAIYAGALLAALRPCKISMHWMTLLAAANVAGAALAPNDGHSRFLLTAALVWAVGGMLLTELAAPEIRNRILRGTQ